ncbi:MAG: alkaline phosphatase family protein [Candidatus Delongbacteria bacterium]|nr:alkaline phosphatase family protein [Candidatus Delongbacteria bacterium]
MLHKPDYYGGSIVNLMSSIGKCFGVDLPYEELRSLPSENLSKYKNIVNIVIDGLGYNYLMRKRKNILKIHTIDRITSVFPSTTSACITSFATGLAPKEHGVTGWFIRLKENKIDIPSTILLFNDRRNDEALTKIGIKPDDVFIDFRLSKKIKNLKVLLPESIKDSIYTSYLLADSHKIGYKGLEDFYSKLSDAVKSDKAKKNYIYGYLPDLDAVYHKAGSKSRNLTKLFYAIAKETEKFIRKIKGTNSLVIITADHGLLDGEADRQLNMNDLPEINKMLDFPLCGEPRAAYCYVKNEYKKDFKKIVEKEIGYAVEVLSREKMIKEGYFGLFDANPKLDNRIGDFILICKENYVIKDFLPNEKVKWHSADHGGLSAEEMFVPLIIIEA